MLKSVDQPFAHAKKIVRFFRDVFNVSDARKARHAGAVFASVLRKLLNEGATRRTTLAKLDDVHNVVDKLKYDAACQQRELAAKQSEAKIALDRIREAMTDAEKYRSEMEKLERDSQAEEAAAVGDKLRIEKESSGIQPALDEARTAVLGIKQDHLNEIISFEKPPDAVQAVLTGVLLLLGALSSTSSDSAWSEVKKHLSGTSFVSRVLNFEARSITTRTEKVRWRKQLTEIEEQAESFKIYPAIWVKSR
jgi:dynein heavy chain 2